MFHRAFQVFHARQLDNEAVATRDLDHRFGNAVGIDPPLNDLANRIHSVLAVALGDAFEVAFVDEVGSPLQVEAQPERENFVDFNP